MLFQYLNNPFLDLIVACDKKWILYDNRIILILTKWTLFYVKKFGSKEVETAL